MLKLNPIEANRIWGYELWIASTHENGCQKDFEQSCGGKYPLLVKIIQANDTLSIQVHPDDDWAAKLEGPGNCGKSECWYILDASPDSKLVYGLNGNYSKEELAAAIQDTKLEKYLNFVSVKKGDFVNIPAGTVHAIGEKLRLLEIQQSCDLTYRLYDWGRGREVHIEKGLQVIKNDVLSEIKTFPGQFETSFATLDEIKVKGGWSMFCSEKKDNPAAVKLIYILEADKAVIRTSEEKVGKAIKAEEIYAVLPGEKITIEGSATVLKISVKS